RFLLYPTEFVERIGKPRNCIYIENLSRGVDPFFRFTILTVRKSPGGLGIIISRRLRWKADALQGILRALFVVLAQIRHQNAETQALIRNKDILLFKKRFVN